MNCLEFRRQLGSDPGSQAAGFIAHSTECPRCAEARKRAQAFADQLARALAIDPPPQFAESILLAQRSLQQTQRRATWRGTWMALAASLALAVGIGMQVRAQAKPLPMLAIEHLGEEPFALALSAAVPPVTIRNQFASRGVELRSIPDGISYVNCCPIGRYRSVHMVMPQSEGPVTVLYVTDHREAQGQDLQAGMWHYRSVPLGQGTLVLLAVDSSRFDSLTQTWREAIQGRSVSAAGGI